MDWLRSGNPPSHLPREGFKQVGNTTVIREAVEAELSFDPLVDSADISVRYIKVTARQSWTAHQRGRPARGA
jgi:hypothetical protein